jgi:tetratricopeptide (TPR) repeat protein
MLKALEEMQAVCDFPLRKMVFVMTDFTENNFNFWRDHPSLKKYFDNGQLDAGIFDAVNDTDIKLWKAGITLGPGSCKNPICVVANYLFDTLYHDIFQVDGGEIKEGLISVGSKNKEEIDPLDPEIIQRMDNHYKYNAINPLTYYNSEEGDEVHFQRILKWYQDYFKNTASGASLLLPVGAMRALRRLGALSNNRALVISGDKGNNHPDQFTGLLDPHIALHGSFSLMVNYHAVGAWFTSRGGFALHNLQEEASLKVSCFLLDNAEEDGQNWLGSSINERDMSRSARYPHLCRAFADHVDSFGPNDFFVLQKSIKEDTPNPPLRTVVALLKLGDWDPDVFFKFRDCILNHAPTCGQKLRNDLCRGIPRVWDNYYMMDMEKDIAFEIGRFYYGIRDYANALHYYTVSSDTVGNHHVTFHNQGLCHYSQGQLDTALVHFRKALALNGDYEKARSWIEKVEKEMSQPKGIIHMYMNVYVYICIYEYVCICVIYVYIYVLYKIARSWIEKEMSEPKGIINLYINVYMYVNMHICIYAYMCIYVYIYIEKVEKEMI